MKIILSRKGFDSKYGGVPSPIFPDGTLLSFPIPDGNGSHSYNDLYCSQAEKTYAELLSDLTGKNYNKCHLDPDLCRDIIKRDEKWKPAFGQIGSSQGHLENKEVKESDLFVFFGRFRHIENKKGKWSYIKGAKEVHLIFGYLQIGEIISICNTEIPYWLSYHPHIVNHNENKKNNTIYVSIEKFSILPKLNGAGFLNYDYKRILTKEGLSISKWNLPKNIFEGVNISYHSPNSWKDNYFQSAAKGQEFVIDANEKVIEWFKEILY
ncbi:MAG TPA: hypothetical protein P5556_08480 [Candidatus Gastranaerophilales bacterium]|nr:hypothetical protein [Candidatus Gastranaerophilales bacterium]